MSPEPELRLVPSHEGADVDLLLQQVSRGDSKAFDALYDVVSSSVYGVARRVVRGPERAESPAIRAFRDWIKAEVVPT